MILIALRVQCSAALVMVPELVVVMVALGLARSPPPLPLNGAGQLCTLQWEGRRPKSGGPATQRQAREEEDEEEIGCPKKATPCANSTATCTTRPAVDQMERESSSYGRKKEGGRRDEISWNSALGRRWKMLVSPMPKQLLSLLN